MNLKNICIAFTIIIVISACKKEEKVEVSVPLNFVSLTAAKTDLVVGETSSITANAEGEGLIYIWSASAGEILGYGVAVTYTASSCCTGGNVVSCTVKDASGAYQTKTIEMNVHAK